MCVCLFVSTLTAVRTVQHMIKKFGTGVDIDNISDDLLVKVIGQGHQVKKCYFKDFLICVNKYQVLAYGVTSYDVTA